MDQLISKKTKKSIHSHVNPTTYFLAQFLKATHTYLNGRKLYIYALQMNKMILFDKSIQVAQSKSFRWQGLCYTSGNRIAHRWIA